MIFDQYIVMTLSTQNRMIEAYHWISFNIIMHGIWSIHCHDIINIRSDWELNDQCYNVYQTIYTIICLQALWLETDNAIYIHLSTNIKLMITWPYISRYTSTLKISWWSHESLNSSIVHPQGGPSKLADNKQASLGTLGHLWISWSSTCGTDETWLWLHSATHYSKDGCWSQQHSAALGLWHWTIRQQVGQDEEQRVAHSSNDESPRHQQHYHEQQAEERLVSDSKYWWKHLQAEIVHCLILQELTGLHYHLHHGNSWNLLQGEAKCVGPSCWVEIPERSLERHSDWIPTVLETYLDE